MADTTLKSLVDLIQTAGPAPVPATLGAGIEAYRTQITPTYQKAWQAAMSQQDYVQRAQEWFSTTSYSDLVRKYGPLAAGSNLFYRLQADPMGSLLLGGGVRGARTIFEAASTFTGGGPTLDARVQQQQGAFAHASQLTQRLLQQQVEAIKDPTNLYLAGRSMGFGADVPGMMAGEMMTRGHLNEPWNINVHGGMKGQLTDAGNARIRKEVMRVQSAMNMMSAGRGMFGNLAAPEMFQQIEGFFGADVLAAPDYYKGQLRELGEISRVGGVDPRALTAGVQTFRGALSGTGLPEDYVNMRAASAAKNLGWAMASRQNQLGRVMTQREQRSMIQTSASQERRRSMSTAGRSLQLVAHYRNMGWVTESAYEKVRQAAGGGSPEETENAVQEVSLSLSGDRGRIQRMAGSRQGFNYEMERITSNMDPEAAARATEQGMAMTANLEPGELSLLRRRERVMGESRDIMRTARQGGISLDVTGAHKAGLAAAAGELTAGGLQGIDVARQYEVGALIKSLMARGVSSEGIYRVLERSKLAKGMVGQVKQFAVEEVVRNLDVQLREKAPEARAYVAAQEYFIQATGIEGAAATQQEVQQLLRAGKHSEAKEVMRKFSAKHADEGAPDIDTIGREVVRLENIKAEGQILKESVMGREGDPARGSSKELKAIRERKAVQAYKRTARTPETIKETLRLEDDTVAPARQEKADAKADRDTTERKSTAGAAEPIQVIIVEDRRTPQNRVDIDLFGTGKKKLPRVGGGRG